MRDISTHATRLQFRLGATALALVMSSVASAERCVVLTLDRDGGRSQGEGVLIARDGQRGLVLTAKHVLRDARQPATMIFSEGRYTAVETCLLPNGDMAGMLADGLRDEKPTAFAPEAPRGSCGTHRGIAPISTARWNSTAGLPQLIWNRPSADGDSGGPVYDDQGRVVSILWGSVDGESHGESWQTTHWMVHQCSQRFRIPVT